MDVVSAATHFIKKEMHEQVANIEVAGAEIAASDQLTALVNDILSTYNNRSAQQAGVFQVDAVAYPFSAQVSRMHSGHISLLDFSLSMLGRIEQLMNNQLASTGGHLLFVHYRRDGDDYALVVKLKTVRGQIFKTLTQVEDATHLSVDTLQVAARINLTSWKQARGERYVTFVSKREQGHTSNYFRDFIGCDVQAESRQESKKLAIVVKAFVDAQLVAGTLTEEEAATRMRHVFEYAEGVARRREAIDLSEVASVVWPASSNVFVGYLNAHPSKPVDQFVPDRNSLKPLSGYSFQSTEFRISMTHQFKTEHNVTVSAQRLIIENPPARLVEELQN